MFLLSDRAGLFLRAAVRSSLAGPPSHSGSYGPSDDPDDPAGWTLPLDSLDSLSTVPVVVPPLTRPSGPSGPPDPLDPLSPNHHSVTLSPRFFPSRPLPQQPPARGEKDLPSPSLLEDQVRTRTLGRPWPRP